MNRISVKTLTFSFGLIALFAGAPLGAQNAAQGLSDSRSAADSLSLELEVDVAAAFVMPGTVEAISGDRRIVTISSNDYQVDPGFLNSPALVQSSGLGRPIDIDRLYEGMEVMYATDGTAPSSDHLPWLLVIGQP